LAVRLAVVRGELGQKLVVRDAGRGIEPGHLFDLRPDRERDVARQRNILEVFGDVEVGLVERERFDDRRVSAKIVKGACSDSWCNWCYSSTIKSLSWQFDRRRTELSIATPIAIMFQTPLDLDRTPVAWQVGNEVDCE
jgi:hypothetical protein